MQGFTSRPKTTLALVTGVTGIGLAFLARKTGSKLIRRFFNAPNKSPWNMTIKVACNESQCETLVNELRKDLEVSRLLGFDCEWVTVGCDRNPVALVQLATQEGQCGLFQIRFFTSFPESLQDLLEDKNILKVGVDPGLDANHLSIDYGINVRGTYDIRHLVEGKDNVGGLAAVVNTELGIELPKNFKIRVSNWEARELTQDQQEYAAKDALAGVLAFNKLIDKKVKVPFFCSKTDQWKKIYDHCAPLIDVQFKDRHKFVSSDAQPKLKENTPLARNKSGQPCAGSPSLEHKRSYRSFCPRKSPLYDNAFMLAPDGAILCTCDTKKAEWYISKGLATIVDKDPLKIKLAFEPSGRVGPSSEYYTLAKANQCVACGGKDSYVRKKIVPHEYRKYFPDCMKKHQSHDVLLLCVRCHVQSNMSDLQLRLELAELCNAPIASDENAKVFENNSNKALRSAARALMNKSNKIPADRHQELTNFIKDCCKTDVTLDLLKNLIDLDIKVLNEDYAPHGLMVVEYFSREGIKGIMKLERIWREHFINVMEPKYLPSLWSVDHYHEKEHEYTFDANFLLKIEQVSSKMKCRNK